MIETRAAQLSVRGRHIAGVALPWGDRAIVQHRGKLVQETFVVDAFRDLKPVPLVLEHRGPVIGEVTPTSTSRGLEVAGDYTGDLGGRNSFSIEFEERAATMSKGLRIVSAATLHRLAALSRPAYDGAKIEVRRRLGPSISSTVPTGRQMDCACPGGGCDTIEFAEDAFEGITEALATTGNLDKVVGRAVLTPGRDGLGVAVDLLDVEAGRDLVSLIESGIPVFARPLIDLEESETSEGRNEGGTLLVRRAVFTSILVKPVSRGVAGLAPVTLDGAENRGGLVRGERSRASGGDSRGFRRRKVWTL